jgi:ELWxxDGT repeat protein
MVQDVAPGPDSGAPWWLTTVGGLLYFSAADAEHGRELWRSDGTSMGTWLVDDIRPGNLGSRPEQLTAIGGRLYFSADDGYFGEELWVLPVAADNHAALTVWTTGDGVGVVTSRPPGINCGPDCGELFRRGRRVRLRARPAAGSVFAGWLGDEACGGGDLRVRQATSCGADFRAEPTTAPTQAGQPTPAGLEPEAPGQPPVDAAPDPLRIGLIWLGRAAAGDVSPDSR